MSRDYKKYSENKIGGQPRPVLQRYLTNIIIDLKMNHQKMNKDLIVAEFGFNHGNDSRFICNELDNILDGISWQFYAYDHEDFYMPENLFYGLDCKKKHDWEKKIYPYPCRFETIEDSILPNSISLAYSYMSLSLCNTGYQEILERIMSKIEENGYFICALHSYTSKDPTFDTYEQLLSMIQGKRKSIVFPDTYMFESFSSLVKNDDGLCDFVFISKKTGKNNWKIVSDLVVR